MNGKLTSLPQAQPVYFRPLMRQTLARTGALSASVSAPLSDGKSAPAPFAHLDPALSGPQALLLDGFPALHFMEEGHACAAVDFIALCICTEGEMQVEVNARNFCVRASEILFLSRGWTTRLVQTSADCSGCLLCISWDYARRLFLHTGCDWDNVLHIMRRPLLRVGADRSHLFKAYAWLLADRLRQPRPSEQTDFLLLSFFSDFYRLTDRARADSTAAAGDATRRGAMPSLPAHRGTVRQQDLFKRFIALLQEHHRREHFCSFYASQLCVTPKYLTTVVKNVSGRSASKWVDSFLLEEIRYLLKATGMSMAEIAWQLNFSNTSFFGKYVRGRVGMSPTALRASLQRTTGAD